jgi:hypothetical protein
MFNIGWEIEPKQVLSRLNQRGGPFANLGHLWELTQQLAQQLARAMNCSIN